jgi:hypothetical protein
MRNFLPLVVVVFFLGVASPSQAQLRDDVRHQQSASRLYGQNGAITSLNQLFSPQHFRMSHSYEMSFGSFGGGSSSLGMYTNTMSFQFSEKLAARVDMSYAFSPFGSMNPLGPEADQGRFFLRNAEIAYKPAKNMQIHLQIRQSPYGGYMSPYGYSGYDGYYGHNPFAESAFHARYTNGEHLFWNDGLR